MKKLLWIALLASAAAAQAQNTPVSAAKKDLVQRIVSLQQPSVDGLTRSLAERPLRQMLGQAQEVLQTMPEDKRAGVKEKVEAQVKKYTEETGPLLKDKSAKTGPAVLTPLIDEKFSEDELRQLLVVLDSPAFKKYQQFMPELEAALVQKLSAELRPILEPRLSALGDQVGATLGVSSGAPAKDNAQPAAKPKAKK